MIPFGSRIGIGALTVGAAAASGMVPVVALVALVAAGTCAAALLALARGQGQGAAVTRATWASLAGAWLVILRLAGRARRPRGTRGAAARRGPVDRSRDRAQRAA